MPNHVHGIIILHAPSTGTIYRAPTDLLQRNYYEHIIRNDEEHKRIHLYIESNPLHWITDDENPETTP
jgi:REP element-mobilizing transposase RayT